MPLPKVVEFERKALRLTDKQRAFVDAYVICWNATEAARLASYQGNDHTLGVIGWQNLQKRNIKEAVRRRVAVNAMMAGEALGRLADIARGDLGQFIKVNRTGKITLDWAGLRSEKKLHLIKSVSTRVDGKLARVEFYSALDALDKILRAEGVYDEGVTVNVPAFDLQAWKKATEERLREVEDMSDIYEPGPSNDET